MHAAHHSSEKGQAIIFLILGLVVFMGFVALAIDGGMVYADRRNAQNVADSSALAGAAATAKYIEDDHIYYTNWDCGSMEMWYAKVAGLNSAINRAAANEITIDDDNTDLNGVLVVCGEEYNGLYLDRYIDITVDISTTTQTSFAHLFMPKDGLSNHVSAVTRVRPRQPLAYGYAIVSLNPSDCSGHSDGLTIHGTADIIVNGGGVFANGCLRGDGQPLLDVDNGSIAYGTEFLPGNATWDPAPNIVEETIPPALYEIPEPDCTGHWVSDLSGTLAPGLYCINNNLMINANDTVIGNGVTIFVPNGYVHINGNATVQLSAPAYNPDPSPAIPGVLFYLPPYNTNEMSINGNSNSYFQGTILATGSEVDVEGNSVINGYRTQIIGWDVEIGGTADAYVLFDANNLYSKPTTLELFR